MELTDRQHALLKKVKAAGSMGMEKLKKAFACSRETLRQDLLRLEKLGLVARSYGEIAYVDSEENAALLRELGLISKAQRKERLVELLKNHRELRISTLAGKLNVTTATVRAYLDEFEREGVVVRKHGAAMLEAGPDTGGETDEEDAFPLKTRILGQRGLFHINPNETAFLDGSPYSKRIAGSLPYHANIPVVTNSLAVAEILRKRSYTSDILILPGTVSVRTGTIALAGARSFLATLRIHKAFFGLASYANRTFYFGSREEAESACEICARAEKIYIILDSSMLDRKGEAGVPFRIFADKVQEIMLDDGLSREDAALIFGRKDPIAICGLDFVYQNLRRRKYRIGFLVNSGKNYFIQAVYNSLQEAAAGAGSASLVIRETEGTYKDVLDNYAKLFEERIDVLVDFTLCMDSILHVGEKCRIGGIKLISVDLHIPGAVYFGADNSEAGRIAGANVASYVHANWAGRLDRIIILGQYAIDPVTNLRISSAIETLRESVPVSEAAFRTIEWGNPAKDPTRELIAELKAAPQNEKSLFIAFNLRHLLQAHDLVARYRRAEHTIMVGQNYTQQIEELMKSENSPLIGCVQFNPEEYGARIMDIAHRMLEDRPVSPLNHTRLAWVPNQYRT